MSLKNRQRRAAKAKHRAKDRARRRGTRGWHQPPAEPRGTTREGVRSLIETATAAVCCGDDTSEADAIAALAACDARMVDRESEGALLAMVARAWVLGWQPAEAIRHVRRSDARAGRLAAAAVAADHALRLPSTLHPRWASQVEGLHLPAIDRGASWVAPFAAREELDRSALVSAVAHTLALLCAVGPLPVIIPPPGADAAHTVGSSPDLSVDDPVLAKVRALLAQAESTTFEAEAEAFTAKAQELMARHAIDAAVVWARSERDERPSTIRVPIDDPYADIKSLLLQRVAHRSRCKAVYHPSYGLESVVGFASDVAAAEVLFTSLLVQSQAALQAEAAQAAPGGRARSRSFRSSFLLAFTERIDARLAEINAAVESSADAEHERSLLPALVARDGAVDATFDTMFGSLESGVVRGGTDVAGWVRGEMAADRARLNGGDLDVDVDVDVPRDVTRGCSPAAGGRSGGAR